MSVGLKWECSSQAMTGERNEVTLEIEEAYRWIMVYLSDICLVRSTRLDKWLVITICAPLLLFCQTNKKKKGEKNKHSETNQVKTTKQTDKIYK